MSGDEYVLRPRDREEVARLEFQHRVWRKQTDAVLERAGFGDGHRLLDIGCGPGFLSLDLARLVGPSGSVTAVDSSEQFIDHLRQVREALDLAWVHPELGDIRTLKLAPASLDGAICRWVLMFVDDPESVVAGVADALCPGGVVAVMEYVQFRSISLWPQGVEFRRLFDAVHQLIVRSGGNPDIGGLVPSLLVECDLEIVDVLPVLRTGRPGSPVWKWLEGTHVNHTNLVDAGLLEAAELEAFHREWASHATLPGALCTAPPLLATIARKPR